MAKVRKKGRERSRKETARPTDYIPFRRGSAGSKELSPEHTELNPPSRRSMFGGVVDAKTSNCQGLERPRELIRWNLEEPERRIQAN